MTNKADNTVADVERFVTEINGDARDFDFEAVTADFNSAGVNLADFDGSGSEQDNYPTGTAEVVWSILSKCDRTA